MKELKRIVLQILIGLPITLLLYWLFDIQNIFLKIFTASVVCFIVANICDINEQKKEKDKSRTILGEWHNDFTYELDIEIMNADERYLKSHLFYNTPDYETVVYHGNNYMFIVLYKELKHIINNELSRRKTERRKKIINEI